MNQQYKVKDLDVYNHNKTILNNLKMGDRIQFSRGIYSHWAIYAGNGKVIHLAGDDNDGIDASVKPEHFFTISGRIFTKAKVCMDDFWNVVDDCKAYINNKKDDKWMASSPSEVVAKAKSKLGKVGYNVIFKNCEHFVNWCRYDKEKSDQVDNFLTGLGVGVAAFATAGLIAAFARYGTHQAETTEEEEED